MKIQHIVAAAAIAAVTITTTACSTPPSDDVAATGTIEQQGTSPSAAATIDGTDRWGAPAQTLDDRISGSIYVNPDGRLDWATVNGQSAHGMIGSEPAGDADKPVTLAPTAVTEYGGVISAGIAIVAALQYSEVTRMSSDAYISTDPAGATRGPMASCQNSDFESASDIYCSAEFTDTAYDSGTYFLVVKTRPWDPSNAGYGEKTVILAAHTAARRV